MMDIYLLNVGRENEILEMSTHPKIKEPTLNERNPKPIWEKLNTNKQICINNI